MVATDKPPINPRLYLAFRVPAYRHNTSQTSQQPSQQAFYQPPRKQTTTVHQTFQAPTTVVRSSTTPTSTLWARRTIPTYRPTSTFTAQHTECPRSFSSAICVHAVPPRLSFTAPSARSRLVRAVPQKPKPMEGLQSPGKGQSELVALSKGPCVRPGANWHVYEQTTAHGEQFRDSISQLTVRDF